MLSLPEQVSEARNLITFPSANGRTDETKTEETDASQNIDTRGGLLEDRFIVDKHLAKDNQSSDSHHAYRNNGDQDSGNFCDLHMF